MGEEHKRLPNVVTLVVDATGMKTLEQILTADDIRNRISSDDHDDYLKAVRKSKKYSPRDPKTVEKYEAAMEERHAIEERARNRIQSEGLTKKFDVPFLADMGIGNLFLDNRISGVIPYSPDCQFGINVNQASAEADSLMGHREMLGIIDDETYDLFFDGFSQDYVAELEAEIKKISDFDDVRIIGNEMLGGFDAISKYRKEHERAFKEDKVFSPILYASKCDPLMQIAADESVCDPKLLAKIGDIAFDLAINHGIKITRVITRPYEIKGDGSFSRTAKRHDRVKDIPEGAKTLIDILRKAEVYTVSIGKPADMMDRGWHSDVHLTEDDPVDKDIARLFMQKKDKNQYIIQGLRQELRAAKYRRSPTYIMANCVDNDAVYGHTQNAKCAVRAIEQVDKALPLILKEMQEGDILIVTADHGMEYKGDYGYHSKEPLPLLALKKGGNMEGFEIKKKGGKTLASVGYVAAQAFGVQEAFVTKCNLQEYFN